MKLALTYATCAAIPIALFMALLISSAHADPQPALDRQLVERMTRALEEQAHATQSLARAMEKCR